MIRGNTEREREREGAGGEGALTGFCLRPLWAHVVWEVRKLTTELSQSICLFDCCPDLFFYFLCSLSSRLSSPPTSCRLKLALVVLHVFPKVWQKSNMLFKGIFGICSATFHLSTTKSEMCVSVWVCAYSIYWCVCEYSKCKTSMFMPSEMFCYISFSITSTVAYSFDDNSNIMIWRKSTNCNPIYVDFLKIDFYKVSACLFLCSLSSITVCTVF